MRGRWLEQKGRGTDRLLQGAACFQAESKGHGWDFIESEILFILNIYIYIALFCFALFLSVFVFPSHMQHLNAKSLANTWSCKPGEKCQQNKGSMQNKTPRGIWDILQLATPGSGSCGSLQHLLPSRVMAHDQVPQIQSQTAKDSSEFHSHTFFQRQFVIFQVVKLTSSRK